MSSPLVITKRMTEHPADSHTMERFLATGGYDGAKVAITKTRDELVDLSRSLASSGAGALDSRQG